MALNVKALSLCPLILAGTARFAAAQVSRPPVRVYVFASGEGVAANAASHSALDLTKALRGKPRQVQVVDAQSDAQITIRVDSRNERHAQTSVSSEIDPSRMGGRASAVREDRGIKTYLLDATVIAGDRQTPLEQEAEGSWRAVANAMAERVGLWVRENPQQIGR